MLKRKQEHHFAGNTRAKLNMNRKEINFLMQSENPIFLLDSIYRMES